MDTFQTAEGAVNVPGRGKDFMDRIAYLAFQIFVFLLPIFFIPVSFIPFQVSRPAFILVGLSIILFIWIIARLKDGIFKFPKSWFYLASIVPVATYVLSAIFSPNTAVSIMGYTFEVGTLILFTSSFILFAITPLIIFNEEQVRRVYKLILASLVVVVVYQLGKLLVGPNFLSFGVLDGNITNLVGKWNDLAVFAGFALLFSVSILDLDGGRDRILKIIAGISLVASVLILAIVNFTTAWTTLFFALLILFVYGVSVSWAKKGAGHESRINLPIATLVTLIISVVFMFGGTKIGGAIADGLGVTNIEARPSWSLTFDIAKTTLKENPLFGAGPNRYGNVWQLNKPTDINNTIFWNLSFNSGIGFIPSMSTTSGLVGLLGILLFIGLLLYTGFKSLFRIPADSPIKGVLIASLASTLFLWAFAVIYMPSVTTWALTLLSTGLFVSSAIAASMIPTIKISAVDSQIKSFVTVLFCVLALIGTAFFVYKVSTRTIANSLFQKGFITANTTGNLDDAEAFIRRAISLSPLDSHYRLLSDIYVVRLSNLLADTKILPSEAQTRFQNLLGIAIAAAQEAIIFDNTNSQNYVQLGRVYESIVPLGVQEASASSKKEYEKALSFNPESPEIYLLLARLSATSNDITSARDYVQKALQKKSNYGDAIYFLSQIEILSGRLPEAIQAVNSLTFLTPNDPGVFFQLGFLLYNERDYAGAVASLERAVSLSNDYANAKYFLGLSYYETKKVEDAIKQFSDIAVSNPDNEEIKVILNNLETGKAPFAGLQGATERGNLPISEQ